MVIAETLMFFLFINTVYGGPVQFPENQNSAVVQQEARNSNEQGEGRLFHPHAIKKKVKKKLKRKLLQCLLSAATGRTANPSPQASDPQGRTLFLNFYDININTNGDYPYDDSGSNGGGICGGLDSSTSDLSSPSDTNFGEGINNLGSFVGQNPLGVNNGGNNDVKPVYENPERFLNRYVWRPLYRSLRPLYYFL